MHETSDKKSYKRRRVLIKKAFQIKFSLMTFSLFFLAAFMVWWELFESVLALSKAGVLTDPAVMAWITRLNTVLMWKLGIALCIVWFFSVFVSHYIAGPIYRIEKSLENLGTGDLSSHVHLRQYDEFKFLAVSFNTSVDALSTSLRNDHEKIASIAKELDALSQQNNPEPAKLQILSQNLKEIHKDFKIS